jgi:hypothetical protein
MEKSLGVVKGAIKRVASVLDLPAKKEIQFLPKLALEGLKTFTLPATLAVSLFSPVNAISLPFKQTEKISQTEKLLKAEKVLREKLVTERLVRERTLERGTPLPPLNVQITINNLTVGSKEDAPAVAKEIASLSKAELKRLLFEIYEELERKRY